MSNNRKFFGFLLAVCLYTAVMLVMLFRFPTLVIDGSVFAVQLSMGYSGICGLFFVSNVAEHFSKRGKE